jgi:regulator of chromosome condensation
MFCALYSKLSQKQNINNKPILDSNEPNELLLDVTHYFADLRKVVYTIACGGLHTLLLLTSGEVYTLGCNDDGALGRPGNSTIPAKVELSILIDIISAGDSHSIACNSTNGKVYQWGSYKDAAGHNVFKAANTPRLIGEAKFKKKSITKILSGRNHTLALAEGKVYLWGSDYAGSLGKKAGEPTLKALTVRSIRNQTGIIIDIFTGKSHSFLVKQTPTKRTKLLGWGLNNYGQLGNGTLNNTFIPIEIPEFRDIKIKDISGGEYHTLVLTEEGEVYGFGKNDQGELGLGESFIYSEKEKTAEDEVEEEKNKSKDKKPSERVPRPVKIESINNIERIFSGSYFNYAIGRDQEVYSWGQGDNHIFDNRQEETIFNPEHRGASFFKGKPFKFGIGDQHVVYVALEGTTVLPKLDDDVFKVIEQNNDEEMEIERKNSKLTRLRAIFKEKEDWTCFKRNKYLAEVVKGEVLVWERDEQVEALIEFKTGKWTNDLEYRLFKEIKGVFEKLGDKTWDEWIHDPNRPWKPLDLLKYRKVNHLDDDSEDLGQNPKLRHNYQMTLKEIKNKMQEDGKTGEEIMSYVNQFMLEVGITELDGTEWDELNFGKRKCPFAEPSFKKVKVNSSPGILTTVFNYLSRVGESFLGGIQKHFSSN